MRDTDRDRVSHFVARARRAGRAALADLRGRTLAAGAQRLAAGHADSARPAAAGTASTRVATRRAAFDVLVGKHGDHVGGERDAFERLQRGEADACAMLDLNWDGVDQRRHRSTPTRFAIVADTDRFDHCVFTVRAGLAAARSSGAGSTRCSRCATTIPTHREMMDLEGLKAWLPGRTTRLRARSTAAVDAERFFERDAGRCERAAAVSGDDRSAAGRGRRTSLRGAAPVPPRQRIDRAEFDRVADARRAGLPARCRRTLGVRHRHRRRAAARQLLFVRRRRSCDGVRLMTLAEMLDVVEDKAGLRAPAPDARCAGVLDQQPDLRRQDRAARAAGRRRLARSLKRHTDQPIKVTLPGPYLLTRAMYVPEVTGAVYATKEDLAEDVVAVLREELADAGRGRAPTSCSSTSRC